MKQVIEQTRFLPIISQWELSVAMETRIWIVFWIVSDQSFMQQI